LVGQHLFEHWGQSVVVDNRGGAGGAIGTELAARASADGYTLVMATASTVMINPLVHKVRFDPIADFDPIVLTTTIPLVLVVHPKVPATSVKALIALAKAHPGKLNFSSSGEGTISHLAGELFKVVTGVNMVHVPFRGGGPARTALIGGHVDLNFANLLSAASHVKAGQIRALAVTSRKRASGLPDVPTFAEAGVPGYVVEQWNGLLAPHGVPKHIIATVNGAVNQIIAMPGVRKLLLNSGAEPEGGTPEAFGTFIEAGIAKWKKVIRDSHLKMSH
jgi:tripartite-type tricarboxylate transporter receptor subunit TctC